MPERKLASIQTISELNPIEGADRIECATVLGWKVVVGKGEFNVGDKVVYLEIDSVVPDKPEFAVLKSRGFRVKTCRLRKQISQGICFSTSILPPESPADIGKDVTEQLGVIKYEPYVPAQLVGKIKGAFPSWLHKTDEIRIQSVPKVLERHRDKKFWVTEKMDGTSMTVYLNAMEHGGEFGVCSRNLDLKEEGETAYWKYARESRLEETMRAISARGDLGLLNFALQGELIGPGIQGNRYGLDEVEFRVFNVYDVMKGAYVDLNVIQRTPETSFFYEFLEEWGLMQVPIVATGYTLPSTVDALVEYSKAKSVLNPMIWREGVVVRSQQEAYDEELHRLSFKVLNPEYLIKFEG